MWKYRCEKHKVTEQGNYVHLLYRESNCEFKHASVNCTYILQLTMISKVIRAIIFTLVHFGGKKQKSEVCGEISISIY